ncbi:MAG: AMP-binding protein [Anaerolineales bacterium]|nr:AMP-binding protein [Anaerolineales bacterium]
MQLFDTLERTAESQPNKPAFIYFSERTKKWDVFTYQQFVDSTNRFLLGLQACSLTPNMSAAVLTPPSIEFFPFACALLKFGIIPIILDPAVGLKKVGEILQESQPDIFIGNTLTHTLRIIFGWGKDSIKHNLTIEKVKSKKLKSEFLIPNPSSLIPNPPAAIIYTSGSTGLPKGAIYTHANLTAQMTMLQQTFNITPDEIDLPAFPLYALIDVLLGVTSVIPDVTFPIPAKTDAAKVINAIQQFNVTNMFASPVVLEILANWWSSSPADLRGTYRDHPLPSLKRIITAGAPATIPLQQKFRNLLDDHTDLFGIYGATETLPIAKIESREIFSLKEKTEHGAGICLGKPIDGVTVRIIPITDEPIEEWQDSLTVDANVVGEITVQSAATTRGYIQREDANRLSKIFRRCEEDALPDEAISNSEWEIASGYRPRNDEVEIIHRMGDVGYFDEEGRLWYCGRKSHRVVTSDGVMFTEQIENIFNAHPQVNRTALVGVNREPVLWVELKKGTRENKDTIRRKLMELAKQHPQASKIKALLFMKKFPTDVRHNSKIIREELTVMAKNLKLPITNYQ